MSHIHILDSATNKKKAYSQQQQKKAAKEISCYAETKAHIIHHTWNAEYLCLKLKCCVWNDSNCNLKPLCQQNTNQPLKLLDEAELREEIQTVAPTVAAHSKSTMKTKIKGGGVISYQNSKWTNPFKLRIPLQLLICGHWVTTIIYFFYPAQST